MSIILTNPTSVKCGLSTCSYHAISSIFLYYLTYSLFSYQIRLSLLPAPCTKNGDNMLYGKSLLQYKLPFLK